MKTLNAEELQEEIPRLEKTLAVERELVLTRHGEPIARLLPIESAAPQPRMPSLKAFRASLPFMDPPMSELLREERDRR